MYHELGKSTNAAEYFDEEKIKLFQQSGRISAEVLEFGRKLIKKGAKPLDILDAVEQKTKEMDAACAFPPQISLNDAAAHSCPDDGDETVLGDDVVKLDVGVHVNGYVTDNAVTVDLSGKWSQLLKANKEALEAALKLAVPGTRVSDIGKTVQDILQSYGYSPVRNLSGHGIGKFQVHTQPSIPNFNTGDSAELAAGMALAIEPFASTGAGIVYESGEAGVFALEQRKPIRDLISRNVLKHIGSYNGLPFAKKWLTRTFGSGKTNFALRQLIQHEILHEYPPLLDQQHGIVSQMEKSVIVAEKPIILTRA
ncbi:type II methionyl aminopeptidase [Candidatus Woesearchaeota archaeon]|nr:type II methionyl aminopeptidase [Candidatus Woesearchaeota archaeon]